MSIAQDETEYPDGIDQIHVFRRRGRFQDLTWSDDGKWLLTSSVRGSTQLWSLESLKERRSKNRSRQTDGSSPQITKRTWKPLKGSRDGLIMGSVRTGRNITLPILNYDSFICAAWSPQGNILAAAGVGTDIHLFDPRQIDSVRTLSGRATSFYEISWVMNSRVLAAACGDGSIELWDTERSELIETLRGHDSFALSLDWIPTGELIATASADKTIRVWDIGKAREIARLEGHTSDVFCIRSSSDGKILASKSLDGTIRLWSTETWQNIAVLREETRPILGGLAFHPSEPILAARSSSDAEVKLFRLQPDMLTQTFRSRPLRQYKNAKVVLVGDTGVGKSGLALRLTGRDFAPTSSGHGRYVWRFENLTNSRRNAIEETRETLLWDLAGQPSYRLIHRLHLHDVAVGLVVFDSRSETNPFAGVNYWARALDQAASDFPMAKMLVAARSDRGGIAVSNERVRDVQDQLGFDSFLETSASRGDGIAELADVIRESIHWDELPFVTTPEVFARIKAFLIGEKESGRVLVDRQDLLYRYMESHPSDQENEQDFIACLGLLESAGLIRNLNFGNFILLQPEMLDSYCGWLAQAARSEPDGLGHLPERRAQLGDFSMDGDDRVVDEMLVFPSELRRDFPEFPGNRALAVAFVFEGSVSAVYATLTVSLVHSRSFELTDLYRNAALFKGPRHQVCGFAVEYPDPENKARGRLSVFFDGDVEKDIKLLFLRYVDQQLDELSLEGTLHRERVYHCPDDNYLIPAEVVSARLDRRETTVPCPICLRHFPMDDLLEEVELIDQRVDEMESDSTEERQRQERLTVLQKLEELRQYHCFLCHTSSDKPDVAYLEQKLVEQGILPWMDQEGILAGDQFVPEIELVLDEVPSALVIVGPNWMGRWQKQEYYALLQRYVERRESAARPLRIIPVLLPGTPKVPRLPVFLRGFNFVDFRQGFEDRVQMRRLVAAILASGPIYD